MAFALRVLIVALSSFALGSLLGSACVPWLWRQVEGGLPGTRAGTLLKIRALPFAFGTASLVLAVMSFLLFEPRRSDERMGIVLFSLAVVGLTFLMAAVWRLARLLILTARLERGWMRDAEPVRLEGLDVPAFAVSSSFPIVALIGLVRPRMIVARSVLASCSRAELRAIVAHERGHLLRRDNVARAVLALSPDLLAWLPIATTLADAWHDAAEEAADDHASELGADGRLTLAEALIHVARLVPSGAAAVVVPASALYRGENLDRRIRRLLGPQATATPPASLWTRTALTTTIVAVSALALHGIHELLEAAVTFLP